MASSLHRTRLPHSRLVQGVPAGSTRRLKWHCANCRSGLTGFVVTGANFRAGDARRSEPALAVAAATKCRGVCSRPVIEQFPYLEEAIQASLRDEADRARFYAQMLLHRFHDPLTADQLRALAVDLERQAAPLRNRRTTP